MPQTFREAFKKNLDKLLEPAIIYRKISDDSEDYQLDILTTFITIEYESKKDFVRVRDLKKWCVYQRDSLIILEPFGKRFTFPRKNDLASLFEFIRNRTLESGSSSNDHSIYKATNEVSKTILNKVRDYLNQHNNQTKFYGIERTITR